MNNSSQKLRSQKCAKIFYPNLNKVINGNVKIFVVVDDHSQYIEMCVG